MFPSISATELKQWLDNDEAILIDVREPAEHASAHIKQATLIPLGDICQGKLPDPGNKKLVIQCKSGMRSSNACIKLLQEDPNITLFNLEGGITAWQQAGFPIESTSKKKS